jgi:UDP-N-acetylglucosamine transferase subunit ALG13
MTTLLVASTGGHLKELHQLYKRLAGIAGPFHWVTFDTPQSKSLLVDEEVDFVPFVGGRDPINVFRNLRSARQVLRDRQIDTLVSTGSAVALPFFAVGRARRLHCHYIESAARINGPSITGRLMRRIPGVNLYAQYSGWACGRWRFGGSVFDSFESESGGDTGQSQIKQIVVSLGTYRGYPFTRLVRRLLAILPRATQVLWQTGDTDISEFGIDGHYAIPESELTEAMREADVVVAHAGVGTAVAAFEVGKCPLLVPRRFSFGEHVDDHQIQIAEELASRSLVVTVDADDVELEHLLEASKRHVVRRSDIPWFNTTLNGRHST